MVGHFGAMLLDHVCDPGTEDRCEVIARSVVKLLHRDTDRHLIDDGTGIAQCLSGIARIAVDFGVEGEATIEVGREGNV